MGKLVSDRRLPPPGGKKSGTARYMGFSALLLRPATHQHLVTQQREPSATWTSLGLVSFRLALQVLCQESYSVCSSPPEVQCTHFVFSLRSILYFPTSLHVFQHNFRLHQRRISSEPLAMQILASYGSFLPQMWGTLLYSFFNSITTGNRLCIWVLPRYPSQYLHEIVTPWKRISKFTEFSCSHYWDIFTKTINNLICKISCCRCTNGESHWTECGCTLTILVLSVKLWTWRYHSKAVGWGASKTSSSRTKPLEKHLFLLYLISTEHTREIIQQGHTWPIHCLSPEPDGLEFCSIYLKFAWTTSESF